MCFLFNRRLLAVGAGWHHHHAVPAREGRALQRRDLAGGPLVADVDRAGVRAADHQVTDLRLKVRAARAHALTGTPAELVPTALRRGRQDEGGPSASTV